MIFQRIFKKFEELLDTKGWFPGAFFRRKTDNSGFEWTEISKETLGLSNVDNTSDANKPISTATANALNDKQDKSSALRWIKSDQQPDPSQYDIWFKPN